jgi:hypothetical protein
VTPPVALPPFVEPATVVTPPVVVLAPELPPAAVPPLAGAPPVAVPPLVEPATVVAMPLVPPLMVPPFAVPPRVAPPDCAPPRAVDPPLPVFELPAVPPTFSGDVSELELHAGMAMSPANVNANLVELSLIDIAIPFRSVCRAAIPNQGTKPRPPIARAWRRTNLVQCQWICTGVEVATSRQSTNPVWCRVCCRSIFGVGFQSQALNHPELLRLRVALFGQVRRLNEKMVIRGLRYRRDVASASSPTGVGSRLLDP